MRVNMIVLAALLAVPSAYADTTSYTGTLSSPEDYFAVTVTLAASGTLGLQTWGFSSGNFDPFVGVFAGAGPSATFIDGASDILGNYGAGCPPAGTATIGGGAVCGDITLSESLTAGTYTVLLSDAGYLPAAVFETSGVLGDGFIDLTPGVFQTCNMVGDNTTCRNDSSSWALDITTPAVTPTVPEPGRLWMLGLVLIVWGAVYRRRLTAMSPHNLNV